MKLCNTQNHTNSCFFVVNGKKNNFDSEITLELMALSSTACVISVGYKEKVG